MTAANSRSEYQRDYYAKNKRELSEKRKERYRADPEKRKKAVDRSREYRQRKARERDRLREQGLLDPPPRRQNSSDFEVDIGGRMVKAHRVTVLADRISRSVVAINNWIRMGKVPRTPFRSVRGERLYTDEMIFVVKKVVQEYGMLRDGCDSYDKIVNGWEKLGVTPE